MQILLIFSCPLAVVKLLGYPQNSIFIMENKLMFNEFQ